jgi:CheY-like chemotaxis protein
MKVINILLVEDDHLDTIDIKRTLDKMNLVYKLQVARNGEEGIEMLEATHTNQQPLPDVTLIDLNMPRMNGLEFLSIVRTKEKWKHLKCFIITTSAEKIDQEAARKLGVSGYIVKPLNLKNPSSMDAFNLMIDLMNMKE